MNILVNHQAPVLAKYSITIKAPISSIWKILTAINNWPHWQSDVKKAHLKGNLAENTEFVWKAGGINFKSKIHTVKLNEEFGWTGTTLGASAIHNWKFSENNGKTLLTVEESLQGFFPSIFKKYFQKNLTEGIKKNLNELKIEVEKQ